MSISIRRLAPADFEQWHPLWMAYLRFYETELPDVVVQETWRRFHDNGVPLTAFGAFDEGRMVGLVHLIFHHTCWSAQMNCYLQDLFTDEAARGKGVGRLLIAAARDEAKSAGAAKLYWMTENTNHKAQALYDKVAKKSGFLEYKLSLD